MLPQLGQALVAGRLSSLGRFFLKVPLVELTQSPALAVFGSLLALKPPLDLPESLLFQVLTLLKLRDALVQGLQGAPLLQAGRVDLFGTLMKSLQAAHGLPATSAVKVACLRAGLFGFSVGLLSLVAQLDAVLDLLPSPTLQFLAAGLIGMGTLTKTLLESLKRVVARTYGTDPAHRRTTIANVSELGISRLLPLLRRGVKEGSWNSPPMRRFWIFLLLMTLPGWAQDNPLIRVGLVKQAQKAAVKGSGGLSIKPLDGSKVLESSVDTVWVQPHSNGLTVGSVTVDEGALLVPKKGRFYFQGKPYNGYVRVVADGGKVTVVNVLPLETYIRSVLSGEISGSWPAQTLRAHAVASRTYAAYMIKTPRDRFYDVAATVLDQVYPGAHDTSWSIRAAVDETRSVVLGNPEGGLIKSFYSSNCGGHTCPSEAVFAKEKVPSLRGVPDGYCAHAPNSSWREGFGFDEITKALQKEGLGNGRVVSAKVEGYDYSGRVKALTFVDDGGKQHRVLGADLRRMLGYRKLRGTRAQVSTSSTGLVFEGGGWGHGVGLCQWGAYQMGKEGVSWQKILGHYYPDARLTKLD